MKKIKLKSIRKSDEYINLEFKPFDNIHHTILEFLVEMNFPGMTQEDPEH